MSSWTRSRSGSGKDSTTLSADPLFRAMGPPGGSRASSKASLSAAGGRVGSAADRARSVHAPPLSAHRNDVSGCRRSASMALQASRSRAKCASRRAGQLLSRKWAWLSADDSA